MPRSLFAASLLISLAPSANAEPIILCGWDTVFIVDTAKDKTEQVWTWTAKQCAAMQGTFATTDDCKPVDGGSRGRRCTGMRDSD